MFLLIAPLILILLYLYFSKNHDYWAKRGVKHDTPIPIFGNHLRCVLTMKSVTEVTCELYKKYAKEKIIGYYRGRTPALIIRDPEIVKRVMCSDFWSFYNRGAGRNPEQESLMLNVFHGDGDTWKLLRQHTSSAYTLAKLKAMFPLIIQCAEDLQKVVKTVAQKKGSFNAVDLMARFTIDFIGACGFGVDVNSMNTENSIFKKLGKLIFTKTAIERLKQAMYELFPELRRYIYVSDREILLTLNKLVSAILEQRNNKPSGRNDYIDLLLELEKNGKMRGKSLEKVNPDNSPMDVEMEMDFKLFVANVALFFGAGFETSSSAMSYTLHELAFYPQLQKEIQEEIDEVLPKYDGKLCYDSVSRMPKLARAFKEAMRKFPAGGVLYRVCTKRYTIPGTGVTIDPGVEIFIPAQALQMDEQYHENPEEFNPERFLPENESKMGKYVYLPFGEGQRGCIGSRLGEMQSLAGLAALLQIASVSPCSATVRQPRPDPRAYFVQGFADGLPLTLTLRDK
ncbi:cytochrome P450 6B5-like [Cydia amplana]|uniref:cytochrome P450 6B5-like n=1 Tax=Cydia amplana TaxID=1869771 RepID=UPI002FE56ED4